MRCDERAADEQAMSALWTERDAVSRPNSDSLIVGHNQRALTGEVEGTSGVSFDRDVFVAGVAVGRAGQTKTKPEAGHRQDRVAATGLTVDHDRAERARPLAPIVNHQVASAAARRRARAGEGRRARGRVVAVRAASFGHRRGRRAARRTLSGAHGYLLH